MLHHIIFSHFLYNHEKKIFPSKLENMKISDLVAEYPKAFPVVFFLLIVIIFYQM